MSKGRLTSFHRLIFGGLFAEHEGAGRYRQAHEPTQFAVPVWRDGRWGKATVRGAAPGDIDQELDELFSAWNTWQRETAGRERVSPPEVARSIAGLYTGILDTHPFVDGNHRAAYVTFAAALTSYRLPLVDFESPAELRAHDRAVGAAVAGPHDPEPFARLLEERLREARG